MQLRERVAYYKPEKIMNRWTPEQEELLIALDAQDDPPLTAAEIADKLGRTRASVDAKRTRLLAAKRLAPHPTRDRSGLVGRPPNVYATMRVFLRLQREHAKALRNALGKDMKPGARLELALRVYAGEEDAPESKVKPRKLLFSESTGAQWSVCAGVLERATKISGESAGKTSQLAVEGLLEAMGFELVSSGDRVKRIAKSLKRDKV